ncbi:dCMP deaminase family protein [Bradyrhizobium sp. SZCCHNS3053]|uniref:deoxycytidylate deaminase n=1 Tax=Bradyrhizobium sp. SZCCHNS3053 TaxID=3057322 RepID=UPI002916C498|nr:dCMP deaminase family protein [Bradyrhizobium sp. SZCCHNS3053]
MSHLRRPQIWWDNYFLDLAETAAIPSKDPSTKVGAVIVRPDRTVASLGYNGFPRGVRDAAERLDDRDTKYSMVVHAEPNAILSAHASVSGCTLYSTLFPCSDCAKLIIQAGIIRVIAPTYSAERDRSLRLRLSRLMFAEAGVRFQLIDRVTASYATR